MPPNQRCVKNKWVFKIKHNGVYQACLVACGYIWVCCVSFSENFSPVVDNITFSILLLMVILFGFLAKKVDIETAYLYGDLEKESHKENPQGMSDEGEDDCVLLNKCFKGLVQAARQYYKKAVEILKKMGDIKGNANPCLCIKKSKKGIVYVS